jgi:hypothetical protein
MRIVFRSLSGKIVRTLAWKTEALTFDDLGYHAKAALSSFYVGEHHVMWPVKQDVPAQVSITDDHGEELVTYTLSDLIKETSRALVAAETVEEVEAPSKHKRRRRLSSRSGEDSSNRQLIGGATR